MSFILNIINNNPKIKTIHQALPLSKSHAACKKFKSFPKIVQENAEDAHPITIAPTNNINPRNSSSHLFIVILIEKINLKRF